MHSPSLHLDLIFFLHFLFLFENAKNLIFLLKILRGKKWGKWPGGMKKKAFLTHKPFSSLFVTYGYI